MKEMKELAIFLLGMFIGLSASAYKQDSEYRIARREGAVTQFKVHVIDELGDDVPCADIHVFMGMNFGPKGYAIKGQSDSNGVFVVEGKTCGDEIVIDVQKQGCYPSYRKICYAMMGQEREVKNGKWMPFGSEEIIVLRSICQPLEDKLSGEFVYTSRLNEWIGYDLKKHDFVAPDGTGTTSDFEVCINWDGRWLPNFRGMRVGLRFTQPYSGFYQVPSCMESSFKGPYRAVATNEFSQAAQFSIEVKDDSSMILHTLNDDACWVVRSRCELDSEGRLLKANYSVAQYIEFVGCPNGKGGFRMIGLFNSIPNDTNLEPMTYEAKRWMKTKKKHNK